MEVVLTGSRAALPGLIEIIISPPLGDTALLTKVNTMIIVEGSRLHLETCSMCHDLHMLDTSHLRVLGD